MLRVRFYVLGTLGLLMAFAASATAQLSLPLQVSHQADVIVDTNQNGIPDPSDGFCSASLQMGTSPVKAPGAAGITVGPSDNVQILVQCNPGEECAGPDQCVAPKSDGAALRALTGSYLFDVDSFDSSSSTGAVHEVAGSVVSPDRFISGTGSPQTGPGGVGMSRLVQITRESDGSSQGGGLLCTSDGSPSGLITLANGLHVLRQLDLLSCNQSSCSPSSGSPNFLRAPGVPFEVDFTHMFVLRDVYIPVVTDGTPKLTLGAAVDDSEIPMGSVDLSNLGACGAGAPTATAWGLIVMALILLAVGTWAIGRRASFSRSLVTP